MKGQVSNELLVVVGFILLLFIPLMFVMYLKLGDVTADLSMLQTHFSVARIAYLVNAIGYMGDGSAMITEIYVPENVDEVRIGGREIVFVTTVQGQPSEVVQPTSFQIGGQQNITSPGRYRLEIMNEGGAASVTIISQGTSA